MLKTEKISFNVGGMHCAGCAAGLEKGLNGTEGIKSAQVNFAVESAVVEFDKSIIDKNGIVDKVSTLGYSAIFDSTSLSTDSESKAIKYDFLLAVIFTVPILLLSIDIMLMPRPYLSYAVAGLILFGLNIPILFVSGRSILLDAWNRARRLSANMNSLIAIGTLTAFIYSTYLLALVWITDNLVEVHYYFETSAMIISLILLGRFLESKAKGKARESISALMKLKPEKANLLVTNLNGEEEISQVPAISLRTGMTVLVKPGEKAPADGSITEGTPSIDESLLTGESMPVEKNIGDIALGGSINGNQPYKMKITGTGEDSYLSGIIRLVTEAQNKKAPIQRLADKIAGIFVPIVLAIAAVTFAGWYFLSPDSPMLLKAPIAVLIIACPCALGLATPTAILAGTGRAARRGIYIRGGDILENMVKANHVIFDKTGTLTRGQFTVQTVKGLDETSEDKALKFAASVESGSNHPLAKAIVRKAKESQTKLIEPKDIIEYPGFGIKGEVDGHTVIVGNGATMAKEKIAIDSFIESADDEMDHGRTVVYVAVNGRALGYFSMADTIKEEAVEVIAELNRSGRKVIMLTGDNYKTARGVAAALGIDRFEATVKPDQKATIVETYRRADFNVIMVGDGINDAPALASANIGVALGSGTDVAIESADVILVKDDLRSLIEALDISHKTFRTIKQNLFWAFFYNVISIPLAAGLYYPIFGWGLSPIIAAGAMAFSSLFVVTNSLRLLQSKSTD